MLFFDSSLDHDLDESDFGISDEFEVALNEILELFELKIDALE